MDRSALRQRRPKGGRRSDAKLKQQLFASCLWTIPTAQRATIATEIFWRIIPKTILGKEKRKKERRNDRTASCSSRSSRSSSSFSLPASCVQRCCSRVSTRLQVFHRLQRQRNREIIAGGFSTHLEQYVGSAGSAQFHFRLEIDNGVVFCFEARSLAHSLVHSLTRSTVCPPGRPPACPPAYPSARHPPPATGHPPD